MAAGARDRPPRRAMKSWPHPAPSAGRERRAASRAIGRIAEQQEMDQRQQQRAPTSVRVTWRGKPLAEPDGIALHEPRHARRARRARAAHRHRRTPSARARQPGQHVRRHAACRDQPGGSGGAAATRSRGSAIAAQDRRRAGRCWRRPARPARARRPRSPARPRTAAPILRLLVARRDQHRQRRAVGGRRGGAIEREVATGRAPAGTRRGRGRSRPRITAPALSSWRGSKPRPADQARARRNRS